MDGVRFSTEGDLLWAEVLKYMYWRDEQLFITNGWHMRGISFSTEDSPSSADVLFWNNNWTSEQSDSHDLHMTLGIAPWADVLKYNVQITESVTVGPSPKAELWMELGLALKMIGLELTFWKTLKFLY